MMPISQAMPATAVHAASPGDRFGWAACVAGIWAALALAATLTHRLKPMP